MPKPKIVASEATTDKTCRKCGETIAVGDVYYAERGKSGEITGRPFCEMCYNKYGEALLKSRGSPKALDRILEESGIK